MNLKERLGRLQQQMGSSLPTRTRTIPKSDLRDRLAKLKPERLHNRQTVQTKAHSEQVLAERLQGRLIQEGVIKIEERIPLSGKLGRIELQNCQQSPELPGEISTKDQRFVYLDTETTGLSGGSGTIIFLLGMATLEQHSIKLEQWLLSRFGGEAALLGNFIEALSTNDHLVSYNGKSYDLPLLISRYRMQGLAHPFEGLPHLDLLHPIRRLFGKQWNDCRLTTLETRLLGFERIDDLPGSQAPEAWFDFVRQGQADRLIRIVMHNRQDVLSLVVAHTALVQAIERPRAFEADITAVARWLAETDEHRAMELLLSQEENLCQDGKRLLAKLSRRAGEWERAVSLWEALANTGCQASMLCLAKYHEHISKDLKLARQYCEILPPDDAQAHRLTRLNRKWSDEGVQSAILYRVAEHPNHESKVG